MKCEDVRRALIDGSTVLGPDVREHLDTCLRCRALFEELRQADRAVGAWVDAFERDGSFDAAWSRALAAPAPVTPWYGQPWAMVAAALLVAGVSFGTAWEAGWLTGPIGTSGSVELGVPVRDDAAIAVHEDRGDSAVVEVAAPRPRPQVPVTAPQPDPVVLAASRGPVLASTSVPLTSAPADCSSLERLEPSAMIGKLSHGEVACLEARFAATGATRTERDQISRILLANAYSMGAMQEWARLIERHLAEVSQADPDLTYKYALYLSKKSSGRSEDVIRWSEVAIDHAGVWKGDTYKSRVCSLHKLRSAAAQSQWQIAVERNEREPSPEAEDDVTATRERTHDFAREWYRVSLKCGKDTALAADLCAASGEACD